MKTRLAALKAKQKGQTLIEVVVAIALGVVVITALVGLGARANRNANYSKISEIASKFAQEGQELVRQIRDQDGKVTGIVCSPTCDSWDDLYNTGAPGFLDQKFDFVAPGPPSCPGSVWCLDASSDTGDPVAPGTGGIRVERRVFVSDDLGVNGVGDCFLNPLWVGPDAGGLELDETDVKGIRVEVTWTDPSGPHTINLQSCITRKT
ncbi:MAG: hypothetical protein A3F35_02765 [Candidatus Woykebacteria bacterium RIFCSPHIGHO2_12_FULL_45_10]|uniref:Uncharacterized protein n=1 Tax=Candidatus Woykebacteria bacterium RIFCSPHIGHO2_12_FULL_45_10 TaxID=1802603 RepID=A0A1G1WQV1_9BACT|nr:MAG: hypothetical protein A3F35_02765 [Candidatus Woykebacteria bacterium RIFCSPHIGHO2_12_FULL_45_10]